MTVAPPAVSVVTVTFNAARGLATTIASVRVQKLQDCEYVVIDGGSRDGTSELISRSRDVVDTYLSEPDNGIYDAMNKGFRLSRGEVIGFLNSGDEYASPDTLGTIARVFEDSAVDACYGDLAYAVREGIAGNRFWKSRPFRPGLFSRGWMPPHPGFFVRRRVYEKIGGFDVRYRISGDYDFMLRVLEVANCSSRYIPVPLVIMEQGGASTASLSAIARANWECLQARRRNGLPAAPHLLLTKPLSKLLQLRR